MTTRTAERVDGWESRPFTDGYEGLRDLADREFSGVVTAGSATCCFLNGAVVGILDGRIEDFEDATGTVYTAPSPALPLLIVMQDRQGEPRAKYYSEDTALSEADSKLTEGGFTGFVELSENVLSGDYYVVYHGGRSMSVAFVGQSEQLLTGEEAFERADDEVGIYEVYPVDVEPVEIPEPEGGSDADSTAAGAGAGASDTPARSETTPSGTTWRDEIQDSSGSETGAQSGAGDPRQSTEATSDREDGPATSTQGDSSAAPAEDTDPGRESGRTEDRPGRTRDEGRPAESDDPGTADRSGRDEREREDARRERSSREQSAPTERDESGRTGPGRESSPAERTTADAGRVDRNEPGDRTTSESGAGGRDRGQDRQSRRRDAVETGPDSPDRPDDPLAAEPAIETGSEDPTSIGEAGELERRTIPSLDPGRTQTAGGERFQSASGAGESGAGATNGTNEQTGGTGREAAGGRQSKPDDGTGTGENLAEELREREADIEDLEEQVSRLESDRDDLQETVARLEDDREELAAELESVREERDRLRTEVERLRSRVEELESADDDAADREIKLTPADAIDQTDLRIRYDSKGDATLKTAHAGEADREDVQSNLTLGYHTLFDDRNAAVEDEPFEQFLEGTLQYRFVEWLVYDLLYEIQETGNEKALQDLYDAIPRIHEVILDQGIPVSDEESAVFDMAFYDVDGNLLGVANVNDNRNKVGETMVSELLTAATRVRENHPAMVAAFLVTASVFNADARRIPREESSGGGLFGGSSRESYISVSRNSGFHLCLVEEDDEDFHLDVPEL